MAAPAASVVLAMIARSPSGITIRFITDETSTPGATQERLWGGEGEQMVLGLCFYWGGRLGRFGKGKQASKPNGQGLKSTSVLKTKKPRLLLGGRGSYICHVADNVFIGDRHL